MPFTCDDFYVGMIAYFTVNDLRKNKRIRSTNASQDAKPRPFVCYAEDAGGDASGGEAYWTPLTRTYNRCKRTIDRKHLRYPQGSFQKNDGDLIVSDGLTTFAGPIKAFADRSERFDEFEGFMRPHLSPEGVAEVQKIVEARGGMMPATADQCSMALAA